MEPNEKQFNRGEPGVFINFDGFVKGGKPITSSKPVLIYRCPPGSVTGPKTSVYGPFRIPKAFPSVSFTAIWVAEPRALTSRYSPSVSYAFPEGVHRERKAKRCIKQAHSPQRHSRESGNRERKTGFRVKPGMTTIKLLWW